MFDFFHHSIFSSGCPSSVHAVTQCTGSDITNAMQVLAVKSDDQSQADLQTGQQIQNSVVVFIMLAEYN